MSPETWLGLATLVLGSLLIPAIVKVVNLQRQVDVLASEVSDFKRAVASEVQEIKTDSSRQDGELRSFGGQIQAISTALSAISESIGWIKKALDRMEKGR